MRAEVPAACDALGRATFALPPCCNAATLQCGDRGKQSDAQHTATGKTANLSRSEVHCRGK